MTDLRDLSAFTVPLALTAHHRAKGFQQRHGAPARQKRVYLNTLAVYAVATYLETLGYDVDLESSHSHNPAQQALRDVADVVVVGMGRLECRPVLPGAEAMSIPAEGVGDRLAYIGVQLDESLRQATLLGFTADLPVPDSNMLTILLADLHPLAELGSYLEQCTTESVSVRLSRWLQQTTEAGWQSLSDTLAALAVPSPSFAFRGSAPSPAAAGQPLPEVGQTKPLTLGQGAEAVTVNLLVGLIPQTADELEIWVQISPASDRPQLPPSLQLRILDADDEPVMQAEARSTEAIQLKFEAAMGEQFSVQVALGDLTLTEQFEV